MDNDKGSGISYSSVYIAEQCDMKIPKEFKTRHKCQKCRKIKPLDQYDSQTAIWCTNCCREEFKKNGGVERDF